jgi:hypothetical protein
MPQRHEDTKRYFILPQRLEGTKIFFATKARRHKKIFYFATKTQRHEGKDLTPLFLHVFLGKPFLSALAAILLITEPSNTLLYQRYIEVNQIA